MIYIIINRFLILILIFSSSFLYFSWISRRSLTYFSIITMNRHQIVASYINHYLLIQIYLDAYFWSMCFLIPSLQQNIMSFYSFDLSCYLTCIYYHFHNEIQRQTSLNQYQFSWKFHFIHQTRTFFINLLSFGAQEQDFQELYDFLFIIFQARYSSFEQL